MNRRTNILSPRTLLAAAVASTLASGTFAQIVTPPTSAPSGVRWSATVVGGIDPEDSLHPSHVLRQASRQHGWAVRDEITGAEQFFERPPGLDDSTLKLARGWLKAQGISTDGELGEGGEVGIGDSSQMMPTLTRVDNTEDFPYCMTVRIKWPTSDTNIATCTGAMIDARHVITAGHCAHNGNGDGWINPYGDGVFTVVPGYDDGYAPYGSATVVGRMTWSGWSEDGDFDYDIAIMRLDRPVGALTGWFGYGTNSSANFYKDNTFYHRGYPGATPYDGTKMYSRSGPFDSTDAFGCNTCWGSGREVRVRSRGYDGESGTGCYTFVGDDRVIYAVHSNGNDSTFFDCVRMDNDVFDDIQDYVTAGTPSSPDLIPLAFTSSSSLRAGSRVPFSFTVLNNSRVSRSASMGYSIYISKDSTISTSDTKIGAYSSATAATIDANGTLLKSGTVSIPSTIDAGLWYVGVIITSSDSDSSNNDSSGGDAQWVYISR